MSTQLYQIPLTRIKDVKYDPSQTTSTATNASAPSSLPASNASSTLSSPLPPTLQRSPRTLSPATASDNTKKGISTVRFVLETPIILESIQLRGKSVGSASSPLQIVSVRSKLFEEAEYHTLTGSGYDVATLRVTGDVSPNAAAGGIFARQRFRAHGLVKMVEIVLQGNVRQTPAEKEESISSGKKMDFSSAASSNPLSPALDATISKTASNGNRFTLPRLNVPKSEGGLNDSATSDLGAFEEEPLLFSLFGYRMDSTPVGSHVIHLLNMATNINAAADEYERQQIQSVKEKDSSLSSITDVNVLRQHLPISPFHFDLMELYQLTGLAMTNSRSFVSASEMYRKSKEKSIEIVLRLGKSNLHPETVSSQLEVMLKRVSALELLVADALNENEHLFAKLNALQMGIQFLKAAVGPDLNPSVLSSSLDATKKFVPSASVPPVTVRLNPTSDISSGIMQLQPDLLYFILFHVTSPLPALQLSAYKLLGLVLDYVSNQLHASAIASILSGILREVPLPPIVSKPQHKNSSSAHDSDADDSESSDVSLSDSSDDEAARLARVRRVQERLKKQQKKDAEKPEFPAAFPLNLSSVERARRQHMSTQIGDAFFRVLRSIVEIMPATLSTVEGNESQLIVETVHAQIAKFFPIKPSQSTTTASDASEASTTVNTPATGDLSAAIGKRVLKSPTKFSEFATTLNFTSSIYNSGSVHTAWVTLKTILLQLLTVCAYALQGEFFSPSSVTYSTTPNSHVTLFAHLFVALASSEEEIRKAALVSWCMLRDVYPLAFSALLSQPADEEELKENNDAQASEAIYNLSEFKHFIIQTLTVTAPVAQPLLLSKNNSVNSSSGAASFQVHRAESSIDVNPFTASFSPPPPSLSPDSSPVPVGPSAIQLPQTDLLALMLDLTHRTCSACCRILTQQVETVHGEEEPLPRMYLQSLAAANHFAQLTNFLSSLLEAECVRPSLRSIMLMHQYFNTLQSLVKLTRSVPITPSVAQIEIVDANGISSHPAPNAPPTFALPLIPLSNQPTFKLRSSSLLSDVATYHLLLMPLIDITCTHCEHSAPKEELLQLLVVVLSTLTPQEIQSDVQFSNALLRMFHLLTAWIPHSIFDDTFELFNHCLILLQSQLPTSLLNAILLALTNKYTVRSMASKYSRDLFIQVVIKQMFRPKLAASIAPLASAASPHEEPFVYMDHLLNFILNQPSSTANVAAPHSEFLQASFKPVRSEKTKGMRGAGTREVEALEAWESKRFESKKVEDSKKEMMGFAIQLLATLVQYVSKSSISSAVESLHDPIQFQHLHSPTHSPQSERFPGTALPYFSPLASPPPASGSTPPATASHVKNHSISAVSLQTFLSLFGPAIVASCCSSITSSNASQRMDAVVLAGLLSSLLSWDRHLTLSTITHQVGSLLSYFFQVATVHGVEINDTDLICAGLVHAWAMVHSQRLLIQKLQVSHKKQDSNLSALFAEQKQLVEQLWSSAQKVLSSNPSAVSIRDFAQWILLQCVATTLGEGSQESVIHFEQQLLPSVLNLSQSKQHSSRLMSLQLLSAAIGMLNPTSSKITFSSIPPALRSGITPFVDSPTPIDTLSSIQEFASCAGDLDFFSPVFSTLPLVEGADSATAAGTTRSLSATSLPSSILSLKPWFERSSGPSVAVQQLKLTLQRMCRDWHGVIGRSARMLYSFFEFSAKVQSQSPSTGAVAVSLPVFHATMSQEDWKAFSWESSYPNAALLVVPTLPASASVFFELEEEASIASQLGGYSAVVNSILPSDPSGAISEYNFDTAKVDNLVDHISKVFTFALERKTDPSFGKRLQRSDATAGFGGDSDEDEHDMGLGDEDASWIFDDKNPDDTDNLWDADTIAAMSALGTSEHFEKKSTKKSSKDSKKKQEKKKKKKNKGSDSTSSSSAAAAKNEPPMTAMQKLASLSPHLSWKSHVEKLFTQGLVLTSRLTPSQANMLFYRALNAHVESMQAVQKDFEDTRTTIAGSHKGTGSPTMPKLGGASTLGSSIAEELDRMVKALERSEEDDEDDDYDDDADEKFLLDDDDEEEENPFAAGTSKSSKSSSLHPLDGDDDDDLHADPLVSAKLHTSTVPDEDLDDDDDLEDEPFIDESELEAAAAKSKQKPVPVVSSDFRAAFKQTAKDHIDSLKTTSARPRAHQSAAGASGSHAVLNAANAAAASNGTFSVSPIKAADGVPKPILSMSPEFVGSSATKDSKGWEGADPDDMGAATSRVASAGRKRPESAGRRRKDILKADAEMDQLDAIIAKQSAIREQNKKDKEKKLASSASAPNVGINAAAESTKPAIAATTSSASASKINIPKMAFSLPLPISTAVSSSRPKTAGSKGIPSVPLKVAAPKQIPLPMPLDDQVLIEEFEEDDDEQGIPRGDFYENGNNARELKEEVADQSSPVAAELASDSDIHATTASSGTVDAEEDPLTFSVHLASKDTVANKAGAGEADADADEDDDDTEEEFNRTTGSDNSDPLNRSMGSNDPTTPTKFHVQASMDDADEMRHADEDEDDEEPEDDDEPSDDPNTSTSSASSLTSPPLRTRGFHKSPSPNEDEEAGGEEEDDEDGEDAEDVDSDNDDYGAQMAEYDDDDGDFDDDVPATTAARPAFSLGAIPKQQE